MPERYLRNRLRRYQGLKHNNLIQAFWWEDYPNFGDDLNPFLLKRFGFTPSRVSPKNADLAFIGSILEMVPLNYSGFVFGSGFRKNGPEVSLANAKVLCVRGHLTANRLSLPEEARVLGDPGLLISKFVNRQAPLCQIGLIPHLSERKSLVFKKIEKRFKDPITIIDVRKSSDVVVQQISQCACILSSSLHGLIVADALGIPSRWIHLSELNVPAFKFHDYYSAFDETRTPLDLDGSESLQSLLDAALPPPARTEEITRNLSRCMDRFLSMFKVDQVS